MLASVAEQASLSLTWLETSEDTFSHNEAQMNQSVIGLIEPHHAKMCLRGF